MEPEIPVGSLVYVEGIEPEDVQEKDVIAFYGGRDANAIITHRVVENRVVVGEFITKGDANQENDLNPVNYHELIGRVEWSVPEVGMIAQILTGTEGKIAAGSLIGLAVVLHIIASILEKKES
jgi:signal peptidase